MVREFPDWIIIIFIILFFALLVSSWALNEPVFSSLNIMLLS
jgi:hypothetical protein